MIYVNPITGPHVGKKMFCYVCNLNTKTVIAVFVKPEAVEEPGLLEAIQKLSRDNQDLETFVVCLRGPNKQYEERLQELSALKNLDIPLTVLPGDEAVESLYKALPLDRSAKHTLVVYRGRQIKKVEPDFNFFGGLPEELMEQVNNFNLAAMGGAPPQGTGGIDSLLDASQSFRSLDDTVKSLLD